MPSNDKRNQGEKAYEGKEIAESMNRAQKSLNRYDHHKKLLGIYNINPETHPELRELHVDVDAAVFDAYQKLRKYIRQDLEDTYWNTKIIGRDDNKPIILGGPDGEEIEFGDLDEDDKDDFNITEPELNGDLDIRFLEEYQGRTIERVDVEKSRFGGTEIRRRTEAALLPIHAYRRAVQLLDEIRNELGFTPEAEGKLPTDKLR